VCAWFLSISFLIFCFKLQLVPSKARTSGPMLTICASYDVFPNKEVPIVGRVNTAPHFGVKSPQTPILGAWILVYTFMPNERNIKIAYYQNYCTNSNQILHSDKNHQILFVGGPSRQITTPRWRTASILKKRKWSHLSKFCASCIYTTRKPLKVGKSAIFKVCLFPHLQCGLPNDDWFLN